MPICSRCNENIGPFSFRGFSKQTRRCSKCDSEVQVGIVSFIRAFREFAADGVLTEEEWRRLHRGAERDNINVNEALYYARPDVIELIQRAVALAAQDAEITTDEEKQINYLMQILAVPPDFVDDVREVLEEYKQAKQAREGRLNPIEPTVYVEPGERCYLEVNALYTNTETKTFPTRSGTLLVTSRKLRFVSTQGSFDIDLKKITGAVTHEGKVFMEMTIKRGNGFYQVPRPMVLAALVNRLAKAAREVRSQARPSAAPSATNVPRTPHQVLNLSHDAGRDEITAAYRQMAKLYHPDKVATLAPEFKELAEMRMKEINAAYQQLTR
jgi:hypothetical protein